MENGFEVLLASDGAALLFLQKEFPDLKSVELPSYKIRYPKIGMFFKWKMISLLPTIYRTIEAERKIVQDLVDNKKIDGIISDGRLGIRNSHVPSVFITHQLNVLTGSTTFISSRWNRKFVRKFDECWVPDYENETLNFSGKLGRVNNDEKLKVKYLGILSRMKKEKLPITIDVLVLLSGPEPQRSFLEEILMKELQQMDKRVLMVRGIIEDEQKFRHRKNLQIVNFMQSEEMERVINQSDIVISRSGYSTIMDLAVLGKKAFFIPTPGQYEQEYLAKRLKDLGIAPSCAQDRFRLRELNKIAVYKGLKSYPNHSVEFSSFFSLFEGK